MTPPPYVADVSILAALSRADQQVGTLLQSLDRQGQQVAVPVLAITGAFLGAPGREDRDLLDDALERFGIIIIAPLRDKAQAIDLARAIGRAGLDPWDAHVAAVARASGCRILTVNGPKWREHEHDLGKRLEFVQVEDFEE